ncbi:MAG: dTDP-4-dehydrorhamnose reductase [Ferruginibacter sp.]
MSKKNILVTGSNGQLGNEFRDLSENNNYFNFIFTDRSHLSIENETEVERYFSERKIDFCINCAAYTAVDKAEAEFELAMSANALAVRNLSRVCMKHNTRLVHISTDYVFNGTADKPYKESEITDPVNKYGESKREGELLALAVNPQIIIIRTSWLYSSHGKNFVKTMIRLMNEKERIGVVSDQMGSPTYAADLAQAILQIIEKNETPEPGIYHFSNKGMISWFDFAVAIKEIIKSKCIVDSIQTSDYPTPAARPGYSVFDTSKIQDQFGLVIPEWKESLKKCVNLMASGRS